MTATVRYFLLDCHILLTSNHVKAILDPTLTLHLTSATCETGLSIHLQLVFALFTNSLLDDCSSENKIALNLLLSHVIHMCQDSMNPK